MTQIFSRRRFIAQGALAAATLSLPARAATDPDGSRRIVGFSKPFQSLGFEETADMTAEIGWDGIECPVRPGGQIEPARAADDLPRMVEALRKRGLSMEVMTTGILSVADPHAEKLLRTAAAVGIRRYRMGYWKYDRTRPVEAQLDEIRPRLKDLAALNHELGLQGCYQNHSGSAGYVGAPIWDLHLLLKDLPPGDVGVCFDIGHATIEGGSTWETNAQLILPRAGAIYVKDFTWVQRGGRWQPGWCPLGQGMVNRKFFSMLKRADFHGPISQHQEYKLGDRKEMIRHMQEDLKVLKRWLAEA